MNDTRVTRASIKKCAKNLWKSFFNFPSHFTNLSNLHVNVHLSQHARNFATLVNTAVGVKEMVHRIFKGMVSHMNRKVVELDLIRRYNTIQALRHLVDGWIDSRFNTSINALNNLTTDPKLYTILSNWYATESPSTFTNIQNDDEDESDGKFYNQQLVAKSFSFYILIYNNFPY